MQFDKKDILYLGVIAIFTFLLLSQVKDVPLSSYAPLADAKAKGIAPAIDILYLPVFIGVIISIAMYALLRTRFQSLPVFIAVLLMVASGAFVKNFILGSFSLPVSILFGEMNLPPFSIQNLVGRLSETILLLPFALFVLAYSVYKQDYKGKLKLAALAAAAIGVISAFVFPLLSLPFLALCAAYAIKDKEEKIEEIFFGAFAMFGIVLSLIPSISAPAIALAALAGLAISLLLYLTESRRKINTLLLLGIIFLSVVGSATNAFSIQRIDPETMNALSQLSQAKGKVAIVSIYDEIAPAAYYLSGKTVDVKEGLSFAFSEGSARNFDYLLIDTLVLDNAKNFSAKVNQTIKFESYIYVGDSLMTSDSGNFTAKTYYTLDGKRLLVPIDDKGNLYGNVVETGDDWISRFSLLELNASGGYYRYVIPKTDSSKNILKVLFPEQTLYNESQMVWESNTSRMRLYKFG